MLVLDVVPFVILVDTFAGGQVGGEAGDGFRRGEERVW